MSQTDSEPGIGKNEVPPKCVSFTLEGPFAHFRKVETSSTRLTYALPPRTTVNGITAAILGLDSNSYYDLLSLTNSAMAISLTSPVRDYSLAINHLGTSKQDLRVLGKSAHRLKMTVTRSKTNTQRTNHNVLRDVSYRIDLWISDEEVYEDLKEKLSTGKSHYTPTLGLSEFLARVTYHGEFEPEPLDTDDELEIDSAIPDGTADIHVQPGESVTSEHSPSEMKRTETPLSNRQTTEFTTYKFRENAEPITAQSDNAALVDNRILIFN